MTATGRGVADPALPDMISGSASARSSGRVQSNGHSHTMMQACPSGRHSVRTSASSRSLPGRCPEGATLCRPVDPRQLGRRIERAMDVGPVAMQCAPGWTAWCAPHRATKRVMPNASRCLRRHRWPQRAHRPGCRVARTPSGARVGARAIGGDDHAGGAEMRATLGVCGCEND